MAEAVVSLALETFRDLLLEEGRFLSGVGDEVRALQTQLEEMKNLLKDADGKQHESDSVRSWIKQIRNLAYRAEDAIETYAVKVSSKRGRGLKKLLRRFSCIINEFHSLHQIGSEISQIKSDLARVSKSMQEYGIRNIIQGETSTANDNQQWKRKSFPDFKIGDCFVGKDDELKRMVSLLVDDGHEQHRVISIWGMGGLGKTTIARKAYGHGDTKRFFQSFAWVCITQQCQIRSVLEDVLNQLNPMKKDVIRSLGDTELIQELLEVQKAKRCMIVLDDLWETDHWDGLKHAFLVEDLKSKILVTTRKKKVAEIGFSIKLGLLSMDNGWELLKIKAFPGANTQDFASDESLFQKIGQEMVKKCGYLPLTISLLGGVLSKRKSASEWELVKENINAYLYSGNDIEKEKEVEAVLNLSYEDLPYYLKPCILYLGLYKEDQQIWASEIYKAWIAQGMISYGNRKDESLEAIAEFYLSELASRSLVQVDLVDEDSKSGGISAQCQLHDVVRELCLSIGQREGFGVQCLYYPSEKLLRGLLLDAETRHLAIYFETENKLELNGGNLLDEDTCKNVRTLLLRNDDEEQIEFLDIALDLQLFKLLRVLHFLRLKFKKNCVPKEIGNLIHLRYLHFEECTLDEVPSSIKNLSYLHTLDLSRNWNVRVPNVLNKLLRLKHLMLPLYSGKSLGDYELELDNVLHVNVRDYALELDEGLDGLETLWGFDSSIHQLKSITRLKNLRSFSVALRDNEILLSVIDAINTSWSKLQTCIIMIREGVELSSAEEGLMVLKKVLACPCLHELVIFVKIGKLLKECGDCVISSRIVELTLLFSEIEDDPMEILGKLPVLRNLCLLNGSFVGAEMECLAFSFPCLKELELQSLPNLRKWRVEEGSMPLLSRIKINKCPHLMMLPDGLRFISSLQKLTIIDMPSLGKRVLASQEDGEGEDFDKIRHVPSIIINN